MATTPQPIIGMSKASASDLAPKFSAGQGTLSGVTPVLANSTTPNLTDIGASTRSMRTTTPQTLQFLVNSDAAQGDIANAKTTAEQLSADVTNKITTNAANAAIKTQTDKDAAQAQKDQDLINAKIKALSEGTGASGTGVSGASGVSAEPYKLSESAMKNMTRYSDGSADVTFEDGTTKHLTAEDMIAQNEADDFNKAQKFSTAIDNIYNGATPLRAEQQAQIENLKNIYNDLIKKQGIMNTTNLGIANVGGYRSGIAEDPKFQTGYIQTITDEGIRKVTNLQTEMISKVEELTNALKNENVKQIKASYDALDNARESLDKSFKETVKNIKDAIEKAQKAQQEQYNQTITSIVTNSSYTYEQKAQAFDQVKDKGVLTPAQMMSIQAELTKQKASAEKAREKAIAEDTEGSIRSFLAEAQIAKKNGANLLDLKQEFIRLFGTKYANQFDEYWQTPGTNSLASLISGLTGAKTATTGATTTPETTGAINYEDL